MKRTAERHHNFSSSAIHMLMSNGRAKDSIGKPYFTYVKQKIREIRLGKPLDKEQHAYATLWGHFAERYAFNKLGLEYHLQSKVRYLHDDLSWSGAPDLITKDKVGDIKCPWTLNAYTELVDNLTECKPDEIADVLKKEHTSYYWQLISNAILTGKDVCELIIYCPYEEDLMKMQFDISSAALDQFDEEDMYKYKFIYDKTPDELPCLKKGLYYKDLYTFTFTASEEDKIALFERVKKADEALKEATQRTQKAI